MAKAPKAYKPGKGEIETVISVTAEDSDWRVMSNDPRIIRYAQSRGYKPSAEPNPWGYQSFYVPFKRLKFLTRQKKTTGHPGNLPRKPGKG